MSSHEIHRLLQEYGCAMVFVMTGLQAVGVPLPGTTALIAAAVYASAVHGLPILGVIGAAAAGALLGTSIGYAAGRFGGAPLLLSLARRLRQPEDRVQRLRREVAEHGTAWLFVGRFISGVRNVIGLVAGASGMPLGRFLPVAAAAACAWALLNGLEYYWFGHALLGAATWLQVLLVLVGIGWMVLSLRFLHRRARRRLKSEADPSGVVSRVSSGPAELRPPAG